MKISINKEGKYIKSMNKMKSCMKRIFRPFLIAIYILKLLFPFKRDNKKPAAFLFRISKWKYPYIKHFLREFDIKFVPFGRKLSLLKYEIEKYNQRVFIIWGYKNDEEICQFAQKNNIPVYRIEDGFVRSVGLGSVHTPPYSLCLDKQGMYFDSTKSSDLEDILNNFDFSNHPELLNRSKHCMTILKSLGISKYNHLKSKDSLEIYGKKNQRRVLVIGQVEDDASIMKGCNKKWTNNDLVRLASRENPEAEIIYKPHPDVLTGKRVEQSDPKEIMHLARVIQEPLSLVDSFNSIDHVYTITSLSGFEALIRDIPVTTVGAPFYSGWGLTDDRQKVDRRRRNLTIEELFAGAYILYPRYVDPITGEKLSLEMVIGKIAISF